MDEYMVEMALKNKLNQANGQGICLCCILDKLVQAVCGVSIQIDVWLLK